MALFINYMEIDNIDRQEREALLNNLHQASDQKTPVFGITGTGGAGKSSLTDELIRRFIHEVPDKKVAIISIDPTKRKTGGSLLGDRIRMNALFKIGRAHV